MIEYTTKVIFMGKQYIQSGLYRYDTNTYVVTARILKDDGSIDFSMPEKLYMTTQDYRKPYREASRTTNNWFNNEAKSLLINDTKTIENVIQMHINYDKMQGYSTDIMEKNMKSIIITRMNYSLASSYNVNAAYDSLQNLIRMNFITSSERSLVHEVGHMKLSKSVFDDDKAVIKIGLLTQNVPVFEKFSVGKNDELILLNAANVSETGRGLEEFLNEIESRDIDNKESYFTSFGIILELILGKDAQQARHDMNLDKIINLIRLISPSKAKACNLVKLLDSYYNKRVINEFYDETDEVRIYAELSGYI
jgi:hypothetical protein